jgi:hypothetical protein
MIACKRIEIPWVAIQVALKKRKRVQIIKQRKVEKSCVEIKGIT